MTKCLAIGSHYFCHTFCVYPQQYHVISEVKQLLNVSEKLKRQTFVQ